MTRISYVLPSRNGRQVLPRSIDLLRSALLAHDEILVVLNGEDDGSSAYLKDLSESMLPTEPTLRVIHSEPGLGSALAQGVITSNSDYLVLSVDDVPFGLSDWINAARVHSTVGLVTATKGHKATVAPKRSLLRGVVTIGFRMVRKILLGNTVRDTQGTFFIKGHWVKEFATTFHEPGYMWTTALVTFAEQAGFGVEEVPAIVAPGHDDHPSRVKFLDYVTATSQIWRISRFKKSWRTMHSSTTAANEIFDFPLPRTEVTS